MAAPSPQGEIDFTTRARNTDPETSHEAGQGAADFATDHHARILGSLLTQGPGTIFQISARTGLDYVAVARRMSELLELQAVHRTGDKIASPNYPYRKCHVWAA